MCIVHRRYDAVPFQDLQHGPQAAAAQLGEDTGTVRGPAKLIEPFRTLRLGRPSETRAPTGTNSRTGTGSAPRTSGRERAARITVEVVVFVS